MEVELLQYRPPQADVCSTYAILWCYGYFIFHELVKSYRACTQSKKASEKLCGQNGDSFSFWLLNNNFSSHDAFIFELKLKWENYCHLTALSIYVSSAQLDCLSVIHFSKSSSSAPAETALVNIT